MKKAFLFLLALMVVIPGFCQHRSIEDVKEIVRLHKSGSKWNGRKLYAPSTKVLPANSIILHSSKILNIYPRLKPTEEAFYVYSEGTDDNGSFVIVSGDERMDAVLGYSDKTAFPQGELASNFQSWLEEYVLAYRQITENPNLSKVKHLPGKRKAGGQVSPIVETTWNQGSPFNYKCPILQNGSRAVTGCVATAMAQILKFYQSPSKVYGHVDYTTSTNKLHITEDLSSYPLTWTSMRNDYNGNYTTGEANAVANLMYVCGLTTNMDYGTTSGAYSEDAVKALVEKFGYDGDIIFADRDKAQAEQWHALLTDNLDQGMPILYSGHNQKKEGHSFIIDGYYNSNEETYYHVNWGWGGMCDGYFKIVNLTPSSVGIGGSSGNFAEGNYAILGIRPDNSIAETRGFLQADQVSITPDILPQGETSATLKLYSIYNLGYKSFTGKINVYLIKEDASRLLIGTYSINDLPFERGWNTQTISLTLPSSLAAGNYTIEVCAKADGMKEQPLYYGGTCPVLTIGNTQGEYEAEVMVLDMATSITEDRSVSVSATKIFNYSDRTFSGLIKLAIADTDDNIVSVFGTAFNVDGLPTFNSYTYPQTISGDIPTSVPNGKYHLWMVAQQTGYSNWSKVTKYKVSGNYLADHHKPCFTPIDIINGVASISEDELPEFYANIQVTAFDLTTADTNNGYIKTSAEQICNFGNTDFIGKISMVVTDANGNVIAPFGTPTEVTSPISHYSYLTNARTLSDTLPSNLVDGIYKLQLAAKQSGCRGWSLVRKFSISGGYIIDQNLECSHQFWVYKGVVSFSDPPEDFLKEIDGVKYEYMDTKDVPIFNLQGQQIKNMQKGINIVGGKKVLKR